MAELAAHYYLDNFRRLCKTVEDRYADLLSEEEKRTLDDFRSMSFRAQSLYVRLISRTGPWFRESKLDYPEIGPIARVIDELCGAKMSDEARELDITSLGQLFTRPELQRAFAGRLARTDFSSKDELLEAINSLGLPSVAILGSLATEEPGRVITPLRLKDMELMQLLFFGNRHQNVTEFVLEDLGIIRYFPYSLERRDRKFENRKAVEDYLQCTAMTDKHSAIRELEIPEELPALAREVARFKLRHDSTASHYYRLCNKLGRDLERLEQLDAALVLYKRSQKHPARERRARIFEKRGEEKKVLRLCQEIIDHPWCEAEQEAAHRILIRVLRKFGGKAVSRQGDAFNALRLALPRGEKPIELLVADHLQQSWSQVHYVENSLMNTLFGLAFWKEIFMPLPGAFLHAYQGGPTDMFEHGFSTRRAQAIDKRLAALRQCNLGKTLTNAYARYHPYRCHWTHWRQVNATLVENACRVIPRSHLLAVFERLLFDPREHRRGFPDLIALGEKSGEYCLVEVKGPGDALQYGQRRWLRYFADKGIPSMVAWVQWADA
ncbi:MAG: VRR-NUC domain-containing protein [Halioglobus sp.]|nr:VRR-NUC domain-containing protein [Halioglobus sp.]